jgi:hypothetical protein
VSTTCASREGFLTTSISQLANSEKRDLRRLIRGGDERLEIGSRSEGVEVAVAGEKIAIAGRGEETKGAGFSGPFEGGRVLRARQLERLAELEAEARQERAPNRFAFLVRLACGDRLFADDRRRCRRRRRWRRFVQDGGRNVAESTISRGYPAPGSRHMACAYYNGAAEYRSVIAGPFLTSQLPAPWPSERVEPENLFGTATTPVRDHRPGESGCSG